jgi:hypothetical protein
VLVVGALCAGCGPSEERASDVELRAAIDRLRGDTSKDGAQRRLQLTAVEQIAARTPAGGDAKSACASAYRKMFDAEDAVSKAEVSMKTAQALGNGASPAVLEEVIEADRLLEAARLAMPACDAAAAKLAVAAR